MATYRDSFGALIKMKEPRWVDRHTVLLLQACDLAGLAAACPFGISQNHPFRDGNKRVAFLSVGLFLGLKQAQLVASQREAIEGLFRLGSGQTS